MTLMRVPALDRTEARDLRARQAIRGACLCLLALLGSVPRQDQAATLVRPLGEYQSAAAKPSEDELVARGCNLLLRAAYDSATQAFSEGTRRYPHSSRLQLGLGIALYAQGLDDQAAEALRKASNLDSGDPRPRRVLDAINQHRHAAQPEDAGRKKEEIARFVRALQSNSGATQPAQSADMSIDYSDSASLKPGAISGSVDAGGYSSQAQTRGSELRQALGQVTPPAPRSAGDPESMLFQRADGLLLGGDYAQAADAFRQGTTQFPQSARMNLGLGVADYSRGLYSEAIDALCKAVDLSPGEPQAYFFLAQAYAASPAKTDEVLKRFASYALTHGQSAAAQYYYALCLWRSRTAPGLSQVEPMQVEQLLQSAILLDSSLAEAYFELGVVLADQGQAQQAAAELERAVKLQPDWAEAHYRLGQVYRRTGETARAQAEFDESERLRKIGDTEDQRLRIEINRLLGQ